MCHGALNIGLSVLRITPSKRHGAKVIEFGFDYAIMADAIFFLKSILQLSSATFVPPRTDHGHYVFTLSVACPEERATLAAGPTPATMAVGQHTIRTH